MTTRTAQYNVVNGTSYHAETHAEIVSVLENCRRSNTRIRVCYGDVATGRDWRERYDVSGTIGRSCGTVKIPLLIHNSRSMGGGGLLDHCIVKIKTSRGGKVLYQHPAYHREESAE